MARHKEGKDQLTFWLQWSVWVALALEVTSVVVWSQWPTPEMWVLCWIFAALVMVGWLADFSIGVSKRRAAKKNRRVEPILPDEQMTQQFEALDEPLIEHTPPSGIGEISHDEHISDSSDNGQPEDTGQPDEAHSRSDEPAH